MCFTFSLSSVTLQAKWGVHWEMCGLWNSRQGPRWLCHARESCKVAHRVISITRNNQETVITAWKCAGGGESCDTAFGVAVHNGWCLSIDWKNYAILFLAEIYTTLLLQKWAGGSNFTWQERIMKLLQISSPCTSTSWTNAGLVWVSGSINLHQPKFQCIATVEG